MVELVADPPYPLSKDLQSNSSLPAFKAYPMNIPGRDFGAELMHSTMSALAVRAWYALDDVVRGARGRATQTPPPWKPEIPTRCDRQ